MNIKKYKNIILENIKGIDFNKYKIYWYNIKEEFNMVEYRFLFSNEDNKEEIIKEIEKEILKNIDLIEELKGLNCIRYKVNNNKYNKDYFMENKIIVSISQTKEKIISIEIGIEEEWRFCNNKYIIQKTLYNKTRIYIDDDEYNILMLSNWLEKDKNINNKFLYSFVKKKFLLDKYEMIDKLLK